MFTGAVDERLMRRRRTEEVSCEREEMVESDGERVFERGKRRLDEMVSRVRKMVEELTPDIDRTCKRDV